MSHTEDDQEMLKLWRKAKPWIGGAIVLFLVWQCGIRPQACDELQSRLSKLSEQRAKWMNEWNYDALFATVEEYNNLSKQVENNCPAYKSK